jgi:Cft2 family RNA processing exonuclease
VDNRVTVTGNAGAGTSGFEPNAGNNDWSEEYVPQGKSNRVRYAETSQLAKLEQLLAVSTYNTGHTSGVLRKGAASAAGWSWSPGSNHAWSGDVNLGANNFMGLYVTLDSSGRTRNYVTISTPVAVCLQ